MKEFIFALATPDDDDAIQRLLRNNPVPGKVAISYERSPSYFTGCGVMGPVCQTLVVRHQPSGELVGLASRAIRPLFINGAVQQVGYLGQLRVDQRFRSRWLVSGGFQFLRQLHEDRRVNGYITTIIEGGREAEGVLVRRARPAFPIYREIDRLHTLAILPRRHAMHRSADLSVRQAGAGDLSALVAFLQQHGAARQFFPALQEVDFQPDSPLTRDLRLEDFLLAERAGALCGVVALWDQARYKQPVVQGYSGALRWGRSLYNGYARCRGEQPLPSPGTMVSLAYAAFTCIAAADPTVYQLLLQQLSSLAAARGYGRVMVGLAERDPFLAIARRFPHLPYTSRLYTVCWKGENHFHEQFDGRINHLEIATL